MLRRLAISIALLALGFGLCGQVVAAPTIGNISLRGLQAGGATTLTIDGNELGPDTRLLMAVPIAQQTVKPGATANRVEIEVSLDAQTPAGIYLLRVATPAGVSNAIACGVDQLVELAMGPQLSALPVALPVALSGALNGATVISTSFAGKQGQRVAIDVESRRLGANLSPVVHLYDPRRTQLTASRPLSAIGGDARCEAVLPSDGVYTIELHDALFRGVDPGFFRLKVGDLHYADLAFPLAAHRNEQTTFEFPSAGLSRDARAQGQFDRAGERPAPWPAAVALLTGSRPRIAVGDFMAVVEAASAGKPQELPIAPLVVSGRLLARGEEDRYRLPVTPGETLRFDLMAQRLGSPVDAVLTVWNEQGGQLATNDDRPGTIDPGLDLAMPADVRAVTVSVRDLRGSGGEQHVYRLAVTPLTQPDFSLRVMEDRWLVPRDGTALIRVEADRAGFNGPIKLALVGGPVQVLTTLDEIPAGQTSALVSLAAPGGEPAQAVVRLVGRGTEKNVSLERAAVVGETSYFKQQPWLREELALAITPAAALQVAWEDFSPDTKLFTGSSLPIKFKCQRVAPAAGSVRVTLLSTQAMPKKTVKVNNQDQVVDDVDRALRLEAPLVVPADQAEMAAKILVPGDLPPMTFDLALKAELMAADNQGVLATAYVPARRLAAVGPITLALASPPQIEARAGLGPTGKLSVKLTRVAGFTAPATLSLAGLPKGVVPPTATVPADQSDFEFAISLPYGTPPGDLAGVRLVGTTPGDPRNPTARIQTNELPLALKVVPGEKPPAEQPLAVFEDQPEFVANLTAGNGKATLEPNEKFSGTASVKVTPDQRLNEALPGLGVKIRETPGPGEYRYLQFAWKKQGGQTVCLQLNHDGQWGPAANAPGKFRYHAGPGPECFGASLAVDAALPGGFTLVTRDLFADFGAFTLTGLALSPMDGEHALFDHIYLGKSPADFELVKP